ncbi:MAG: hypothetical protein M3314_13195, partial [Actinomycetota bacterium]|nr:hypothetical protein [Actinomycetota bacterium]
AVPPPPSRSPAGAPPASPPGSGEGPRPQATSEAPPRQQGDRVEALFARIKADRASVVAKTSRVTPTPPEPSEPPEPSVSGEPAAARVVEAEPTPAEPTAGEAAKTEPALPGAPAVGPSRDISDESARTRRDELLEPSESTLVRQLKRALQDEQNEVLDQLRRQRRPTALSVLPPSDRQLSRFRDMALPPLTDAVRAGARFAAGSQPTPDPGPDLAFVVASALASAVVEPLRSRLERQLPATDAEGGSADPAQLSEVVSAAYRQWRAQELEPLARHHAADAFARGAFAAYPDGIALRWVVDDEAPCPDCDDNELAASVTKGESYPTGQVHPPAHPGCRCLLVPAVP